MTHTVDELMELVEEFANNVALGYHQSKQDQHEDAHSLYAMANKARIGLRTALEQSLPRWRPISEAPDKGGAAIVCGPGWYRPVTGMPTTDGWFATIDDGRLFRNQPTHWQPLPSPPTEPTEPTK